jgi:hypothetical protein
MYYPLMYDYLFKNNVNDVVHFLRRRCDKFFDIASTVATGNWTPFSFFRDRIRIDMIMEVFLF